LFRLTPRRSARLRIVGSEAPLAKAALLMAAARLAAISSTVCPVMKPAPVVRPFQKARILDGNASRRRENRLQDVRRRMEHTVGERELADRNAVLFELCRRHLDQSMMLRRVLVGCNAARRAAAARPRHQQFFAPLRDGRLVLDGVFRATGTLQQIEPRSLDARKWIDLDDNGLYELEPDGSFRHVWEGLTIRSAVGAGASAVTAEAGHVVAPETAPPTSFSGLSGLTRSECKVHRAAMAVYPDGIPAELSLKQLCRELQPRVMHMGFGAVSESTIKRYIWKYRRRRAVKNIRSTHQT